MEVQPTQQQARIKTTTKERKMEVNSTKLTLTSKILISLLPKVKMARVGIMVKTIMTRVMVAIMAMWATTWAPWVRWAQWFREVQ